MELLQAFFSHDNIARTDAERQLKELAEISPNASLDLYLSAFDLAEPKLFELAAVSIKEYHLKNSESFANIDGQRLETLITKSLSLLSSNPKSLNLCKRVVEILVSLYANDDEEYSFLVEKVLALQDLPCINTKISIMYFVDLLCVQCFDEDYLKEIAEDLTPVFEKFITDNNKSVVIATVKALTTYLSNIEDKEILKNFSSVLPTILTILVNAVKEDENAATSILQSFDELIEVHSNFIKPSLEDIFVIFAEILVIKELQNGLRNQTITCIQTISSSCDVAVRKSENFKTKIVPAYMKVLVELDQYSIEEWASDIENQNLSKESPCFFIQDSLIKLASILGPKFLLPQFIPFIVEGVKSEQWSLINASYLTIGALIHESSGFFANEMDQIVNIVLAGLNHQDPRVIYTVIDTIGVLSEEYAPNIQKKYHSQILESILKLMNSDVYLKLQIIAVNTVMAFCKGIVSTDDKTILTPYMEQLVSSIIVLIERALGLESELLLEEVLNVIPMFSSALGTQFVKYYSKLMPILRKLLENIPTSNEKGLKVRVKTIECIGFVMASALNEQGFSQEVDQNMEYFICLQQKPETSGLEHASIINLYCQLSSDLHEEFGKYMPFIFEKILAAADIEVGVVNASEDPYHTNGQSHEGIGINTVKSEVYTLDTSAMTLKISAAEALYILSKTLGKAFYQYIEPTLVIIKRNFDHVVKTISRKGLKTIKNLVLACENETDVVKILNDCLPAVFEQLNVSIIKIEDVIHTRFIFKQIYKSVRFLTGPLLDDQVVLGLINWMGEGLALCQKEKLDLLTKFRELAEFDEQKKNEFKEEYEKSNEVMKPLTKLSGLLLKHCGYKIEQPIHDKMAKVYFDILNNPEASSSEVLYAVRFFNSFLESSSSQAFEQIVVKTIAQYIQIWKKAPSSNTLQACINGIGAIVRRINRTEFSQIKQEILDLILDIISASDAYTEDKLASTGAAIRVLGDIALRQYTLNDRVSEEILLKYLELLPLKSAVEEAQISHRTFLDEIQNKNEFLVSTNQTIQEALFRTVELIKQTDEKCPEEEILDDYSRELVHNILRK